MAEVTEAHKIGGKDCTVEVIHFIIYSHLSLNLLQIDESLFGNHKYGRGRMQRAEWILGGK